MTSPAAAVVLTQPQRRAVEHRDGPLIMRGGPRSGRTTALVARWQHLRASGSDPARILFLCRDAIAARSVRSALLGGTPSGGAALHVASPWALAFDVLQRTEPEQALAGHARRRELIAGLLRALPPEQLAQLSPGAMTTTIVDELADLSLSASPDAIDRAAERADHLGCGQRWTVATTVVRRYHDALHAAGLVDPSTLLERAAGHLSSGPRRFDTVLVDDVALGTCGWGSPASLLDSLVGMADVATAACDVDQALPSRLEDAPVVRLDDAAVAPSRSTTSCHHPSVEGEAVARIVIDRMADGCAPEDIAVVCRRPGRAARIVRALGRNGLPVAAGPMPPTLDPHVQGLIAMLRWVAGDGKALPEILFSPVSGLDADARHRLRRSPTVDAHDEDLAGLVAVRDRLAALADRADVARVAHAAFEALAGHLVPAPGPALDAASERSLDAVVAWIDDLAAQVDHDPALTLGRYVEATSQGTESVPAARPRPGRPPGTIAVVSPDELRGGAWRTLVVCGAVEGELPRISADVRYLDRALLDSRPVPSPAARRAAALADERRLFADLLRRATQEVVAVAATEPGVLMSRFVSEWQCESAALPRVTALDAAPLPPTTNGIPLHPGRSIRLSASQLDTYAECPRRYLYDYPLRIRGDANVWADFGTMVHDILEDFIGPDADETDLSWERLVSLAEAHWRDEIAEYRPQREELRRDLMEVLRRWFEAEGSQIGQTLHVLKAEQGFSIPVGDHTVTGRIDRVDRADDGFGIRILDYKTSKRAKAQADMADDLQLRMYHLAAVRDPDLAAFGPPSQLRLLFLREMKARDQEIAGDHEATTVAIVQAMADEILAEHFEPSAGSHCRYCAVKRLCPLWPEGRQAGEAE